MRYVVILLAVLFITACSHNVEQSATELTEDTNLDSDIQEIDKVFEEIDDSEIEDLEKELRVRRNLLDSLP